MWYIKAPYEENKLLISHLNDFRNADQNLRRVFKNVNSFCKNILMNIVERRHLSINRDIRFN